MKKLVAEVLGTFALVFAGSGAIIVNEASNGAISHVGIALTFGLIILAMIYTFGDISGAHFNPAVTIGFWAARRLPGREVAPYIAAQCLGALFASGLHRLLFPESKLLGATMPSGPEAQSFMLETLLTFHAHHSKRINRRKREGHHGRHRHRIGHRARSHVCRPHLRRLHEPGTLACARADFHPHGTPLDLSSCACARSRRRHSGLPVRAGKRVLFTFESPSRNMKDATKQHLAHAEGGQTG